jgi:hypothetical protein
VERSVGVRQGSGNEQLAGHLDGLFLLRNKSGILTENFY